MPNGAQNPKTETDARRRAEEALRYQELAGSLAARMSNMPANLSKKNILDLTFNEINKIQKGSNHIDDLQADEVSSSKPNICSSSVLGPWLLEAIDGFLFLVDQDGIIEYITNNVYTFLRYKENELRGKPIANIIHIGDLAKFNSKLLPMSALSNGWSGASTSNLNANTRGNGGSDISSSSSGFLSPPCSNDFSPSMLIGGLKSLGGGGGSTSASGANKRYTFNVRFLVNPRHKKSREDDDEDNEDDYEMNEDDDHVDSNNEFILSSLTSNSSNRKNNSEFGDNSGASARNSTVSGGSSNKLSDDNSGLLDERVYENLQLSITSLPAPNSDRSSSSSSGNDFVLFCMARRIPETDDSSLPNNVEQFSTKMDLTGKILSIDTSGVSSTYSQYLNKALIDKCILDLGDPLNVITDHLKKTVQGNSELSPRYKFRVAPDKYLLVQSKSRRWDSDPPFISSLHSIITNPDETAGNVSCQPQTPQQQKQLQQITLTGTSNALPDNLNVGSPASLFARDCLKTAKPVVSSPFRSFAPVSPSGNAGSTDYSINDCLGFSKMFPSGLPDFDTYSETVEGSSSDGVSYEADKNSNDLNSLSQNSQASVNVSSLMPHASFAPSISSPGSNLNNSGKRNSPIPIVTPSSTTSSLRMGNTYSNASNEMLSQGDQVNQNNSSNSQQNQQQHQQQQQQQSQQQQQQSQSQSQSQSHSGQSSQSQQSSGNSPSQPPHGSGQGSGLGLGSGSSSGQQPQQPPSSSSSRQPSPAPGSVPIQQLQLPSPEQTASTPQAIQSPSGPGSTQKLRNLLTQGIEADSPSNSDINQSNSGNNDLLRELLKEEENVNESSANNKSSALVYGGNPSSNLLSGSFASTSTSNQPTTSFGDSQSSLSPNLAFKSSNIIPGQCSNDNVNNNNMLRKLLNEDDSSKSYRRNQELLHQWKEDGQSSSSNLSSGLPSSLSELMSPTAGSTVPSSRFTGGPGSVKRKSVDEHQLENETISGSQPPTPGGNFCTGVASKRPSLGGPSPGPQYNQLSKSPLTSLTGGIPVASSNQSIGNISSASSIVSGSGIGTSSIGSTSTTTIVTTTGVTCGSTSGVASSGHSSGQPAQLAIQNPMLTSMLAQTPKTLPAAPISIPTSIVSQVPQERLPKNLEKKLIHTPANQMIGITSSASSSSPTIVSSHVTSGGPQGMVSITNASISSSSHLNVKPRQSVPPPQQHQQSQQSQIPPQLHQIPQQPHLPQTSQQAQAFVISNSGQHQNFRPLHSQTQVQIVQTPARYPVFPDNRATAQQIQHISNVQPGLHHHQLQNSGGQPIVSGQIKNTLSGSTQLQQQPLPQVSPQSSNVQSHVAFIDSISSTTSSSISSSSILASATLATVQDPQDPILSEILEQVWSMQQEMNIESTQQNTITATAHSTTDDMILDMMLDEVLDPPSSNVSVPTTINIPPVSGGISVPGLGSAPQDFNEMKAISEIRRQLMSCETSPSQPNHPGALSNTGRPPVFAHQTGSLPSPSLQQQPNFSNNPAFQSPLCPPPAYGVTSVPTATSGPVHGVTGPPQTSQQLILQQPGVSGGPGMRRFPGPPHPNGNPQAYPTQIIQHRATEHSQFNVTPGVVGPPLQPRGKGLIDSKKQRLFIAQQQEQEKKRLLAQQNQQEYTLHTSRERNENDMPPNVSLQIKSRMGSMTPETGQLSPRYPILNVGAPSGGVQAQSSLPQSPAGGGNGPPPSSVATSLQSSYTSPSTGGPSTTYGQPAPQPSHRMSPHPYTSVSSPAGGCGPNSPAAHLQLASPQPSSTSSPVSAPHGWPPPVSTSNVPVATGGGSNSIRNLGPTGLPANRIQQQNPMLNAQLSQGTFSSATAQPNIRCTPQQSANQRLCNNRTSMASPSPSSLHSASRNSPIPQYPSSPGIYQTDRQTPGSSVGSLGPQSSSSGIGQPRILNQPLHPQQTSRPQMMSSRVNSPRFATRSGVSSGDDGSGGPGGGMGSPYSYPQPSTPIMDSNNLTSNQFIFDNRSVSGAQTSTSNANPVSSEFIRQNLRAIVGARTQQTQQQQQAQVQQQSQPQQAQQQPSVSQQSQPPQQPNQHLHQSSSMTSTSQSNSSNMLCVSSSSNPLTAADLEAFGFFSDFSEPGVVSSGTSVTSNCGPGSPLFSSIFDNGSQVSSPLTSSSSRAQGPMAYGSSDNNSGSDQKKSLLQELLSSPP